MNRLFAEVAKEDMAKSPLIDYESRKGSQRARVLTTVIGVTACSVGLIGASWPVAPLWRLYHIPDGTAVRPMGLEMLIFLCAAASLFVAMPLGCWCICRSRAGGSSLVLGFAALLMGALGASGGYALYFAIIHIKSLVLEG